MLASHGAAKKIGQERDGKIDAKKNGVPGVKDVG